MWPATTRAWRISGTWTPGASTWSRLFRVPRKRSLNNKDAERLCERAAPAPTEVVRGDARVGISRKHGSLAIEQQVCLGSSRAIPRAGSNFR